MRKILVTSLIRTRIQRLYEGRRTSISSDYLKFSLNDTFENFCINILAAVFSISELSSLIESNTEKVILDITGSIINKLLKEETSGKEDSFQSSTSGEEVSICK